MKTTTAKFLTKRIFLFAFFQIFLFHTLAAQEKKSKAKLTGNIGLYGDFYHMQSDTPGAVAARRPDYLGRFVVNTNLTIGKFSMPVSMTLSSGHYSVIFPNLPKVSGNIKEQAKQTLLNPLNRVGIAPKYKSVQILLGAQIPQYSHLSLGDLSIFGAGFALTPGKFRCAAFAGKSQIAVEADTIRNHEAIYARIIRAAKIGIGHEDSSHLYLIACQMADDTNSLQHRPSTILPQAGSLLTLDYRLNISSTFYVKGEIAGSGFTRNSYAAETPATNIKLPTFLFIPKTSSRLDYATELSVGNKWKNASLSLDGKYYGDGFVAMGFPFMQTDRLETTLNGNTQWFRNRVQISGNIGRRFNNLSGIRATTSTQTIGAINGSIQFSNALSLSGSYSNYGIKNTMRNDTFKVDMITQSWGINPVYNHTGSRNNQFVSINWTQNQFTDYNIITGIGNNNDAYNAVLNYGFSGIKIPITATCNISYLNNHSSVGDIETKSAGLTVGYKFLKKKLQTQTGLQYSENKLNALHNGKQIILLTGIKYRIQKRISAQANASLNQYQYGISRPGIKYKEFLLRTSVNYTF